MRALTQTVAAGWPISAALAIALAGQSVRSGRRRTAINQALHELRRPLQGLTLALPGAQRLAGGGLDLAIVALARLDAEVNGAPRANERLLVGCRGLLEAAVARWRARAALTGGSLELRLKAPDATVLAEPDALAQAVDNLIVNALEHGGPSVIVEADAREGRVRLAVADSGSSSRPPARRETPRETISRLTGRRRHGHGLEVVREVAASHGGRFAIQRSERGTIAVLELPLARDGGRRAA